MDSPRLRDLCVRYYRDIANTTALREQEAAVLAEIQTLESIAEDPSSYPSQGVVNYTATAGGRSQRKSDPTPRVAAQHQREVSDVRGRIRGLRRELADVQRSIGDLLASTAAMRCVIISMAPVDRRIIELRWGPSSTRATTVASIANILDCDPSTVTRRLRWLDERVPSMLQRVAVPARRG